MGYNLSSEQYDGQIDYPLPPDAYVPSWAKTTLPEIWSGIMSKIAKLGVGVGDQISYSAKWGELFQGGYEVEISGDVSTCVFKKDKSAGLMFSGSVSVSGLGGVGAGAEAGGNITPKPTGSATICKECESNIKPIVGELSLVSSGTAGLGKGLGGGITIEQSLGTWDTSKGFEMTKEWPTISLTTGEEGANVFIGLKLSGSTKGSYAWKNNLK